MENKKSKKLELYREDFIRCVDLDGRQHWALPQHFFDAMDGLEVAEDANSLATKIATDAAEAIRLAKIKEEESKALKLAEKKRLAEEKAKLAAEAKAEKKAKLEAELASLEE